jgi:protoporphyrinogen oxidase
VHEFVDGLRWAGVYNLNLGVERDLGDRHWIYFPEAEWAFYRVGFPHNFSPAQAPAGCGSLYAEVSYSPSRPLNRNIDSRIKLQLQQVGILKESDKILAECALDIPCAYVIYDHHYRRCVPPLKKFLREQGIYPIGRYGAWEYGSMEDALRQGMEIAEEIG